MPHNQNLRFDKKMYWYRRDKGWRGQFEVAPVVAHHRTTREWPTKPVTKKAFLKNTKRARKEEYANR